MLEPETILRVRGTTRPVGATFERLRDELHATLGRHIGLGCNRTTGSGPDGWAWTGSWPGEPYQDWPAIAAALRAVCERVMPGCPVEVDYSLGCGEWRGIERAADASGRAAA